MFNDNELPMVLLSANATDADGNEGPLILSYLCRSQAGHYYLIEAAGDKALTF